MKRILIAFMALVMTALSTNAMSYEQARREALFLTDKMAYELNLSQEQYDAAYEINLDYLMGVSSVDDVYSDYWTRRNLDLSYILLDWQWNAFRAATYFYRPLYWDAGCWHFGVYARYPRRTFFYFDRPSIYVSYRGGHSWRANGGHSFYHNRRDEFRRAGDNHFGMRDGWDNGNYRGVRDNGRGSSTRVTVNNNRGFSNNRGTTRNGQNTNSFGTARSNGTFGTQRTTTGTTSSNNRFSSPSKQSGSFGTNRSSGSLNNRSAGSFSAPRSTSKSSIGNTRSAGSFSTQRSAGSFSAPRSSSASPSKSGGSNSRGGFSGRR